MKFNPDIALTFGVPKKNNLKLTKSKSIIWNLYQIACTIYINVATDCIIYFLLNEERGFSSCPPKKSKFYDLVNE